MPSTSDADARALDGDLEDHKAQLRTDARDQRTTHSDARRSEAAISIASHLLAMDAIRDASCVSVYASRSTEPGTTPLIQALADKGARVLMPVLGDGLQRGWAEFTSSDDLVERAPGRPPEPSGDFLPGETLAEADVIVVPALAADGNGTRLGQGGGWYDRALQFARDDAPVIAVVYTDEMRALTDALPREEHDVPVNAVVTPDGITVISVPNAT